MRPEKFGKLSSTEATESEKGPELTDSEKLIFGILSKTGSMDLAALKEAAGLSNKQWGLGKYGLTKVVKTDDALLVEVVG